MEKKEYNLIDYLYTIVKWRKLIILNFFIVCLITIGISLLLPKWYEAKTIILPPEQEGFTFSMGSAAQFAAPLLGGGGFELPMFATSSDVYETILKSRIVRESILKQFDLMKIYKSKNIELAHEELEGHTKIEVGRDRAIHVRFEAKEDPKLAADVANAYIKELDKVNKTTNQSKATLTRQFVEKRLEQTKIDLKNAEEELKDFQQKHNTVSLPEQTQASIAGAAELYSQLMALRIQLSVLEKTVTESHTKILSTKVQISEIDKMLNELKYGKNSSETSNKEFASGMGSELFVPFAELPEIGLKLARRMREAKIQELLFELLTQQYEQSKIQEAKDTSTIQILDKARPPFKKSRPTRAIIVVIAGFLSVVVSLFLAFYFDYLEKLKVNNFDEYQKIKNISATIKKDFRINRK